MVTVPFPFADRAQAVVRPAVVLSPHAGFGEHTRAVLLAMITSARHSRWPGDVAVEDLAAAGLRMPCVVRMKLNTVGHDLIDRRIGSLGDAERGAVRDALTRLLTG